MELQYIFKCQSDAEQVIEIVQQDGKEQAETKSRREQELREELREKEARAHKEVSLYLLVYLSGSECVHEI